MELRRYGSLLKRWLWLIISLTLAAALGAFAINSLTAPIYRASTTLLIDQAPSLVASPNYDSLLTGERLAKTYRELMRKRPVLSRVIEKLNLNLNAEQLAGNVIIDIVRDTQLMVLSVEDPDPQKAVQIANEIAKEFNAQNLNLQANRYSATKQSLQEELTKLQSDISQTQATLDQLKASPDQATEQNRLQTLLAQYRNSYSSLLKSFEDVRLAEAQSTSDLNVVEEAQTARKVRPNTLSNTLLAAFVGLLLAIGLAFLIEYLDDSIKTTEQVEQLSGVSTLGIIARIKGNDLISRLVTLYQPDSPAAEAYRVLRANIEFSEIDNPIRTIVVTSSHSGEGKSTTVANLAVAMAQTGKRVILVDTDLRRPSLHRYFQKSNGRGVTTALLEPGGSAGEHLAFSGVENLHLLLSGPLPPNPSELLGSQRMIDLVEELTGLADVILFDSSPLLPVVDPTLMARISDATLIVVHSGVTRAGALKKAKNQLLQSGTRLLGVVLNRVSTSHSTYYYYYHDNYTSGKDVDKGKRRFPFLPAKNGHHRESVKLNGNGKGFHETPALSLSSTKEITPGETLTNQADSIVTANALVETVPMEVIPALTVLASLEVKHGSAAGRRFEIMRERVIIGKLDKPKNSKSASTGSKATQSGMLAILEDEQINREHIEIVHRANGAFLRDLNTSSGTWLNGRKLNDRPARLKDGAEIRLGSRTTLIYHEGR